jgi:mRNA interferase HicA
VLKRRDLEKALKTMGWEFKRHGGKHDVWTNGEIEEMIP